jgi:hypothetical protein
VLNKTNVLFLIKVAANRTAKQVEQGRNECNLKLWQAQLYCFYLDKRASLVEAVSARIAWHKLLAKSGPCGAQARKRFLDKKASRHRSDA